MAEKQKQKTFVVVLLQRRVTVHQPMGWGMQLC